MQDATLACRGRDMKLDTKALALAVAMVTAGGYLLWAALVALSPHGTMVLLSTMMHAKVGAVSWSMSLGSVTAGLILTTGFAALSSWLVGAVYNLLVEAKMRQAGEARSAPLPR